MKQALQASLSVVLLLLAGCTRERPTAQAPLPPNTGVTNTGGDVFENRRTNTLTGRILIQEIIFKDLGIEREPGPAGYEFGYYIVSVDPSEFQHFSNYYKGHVPRVVVCCAPGTTSTDALVDEEMQDRETKLHCKLLYADIKTLDSNSADVSAGVISGRLGGAFYDYSLINENKSWRVVEKKLSGAF